MKWNQDDKFRTSKHAWIWITKYTSSIEFCNYCFTLKIIKHSGSHAGGKSAEHLPASNPPPPRYQTIDILDILNQPGRAKRPSQIVVILRGLPGSGKSYIAKLIKVNCC